MNKESDIDYLYESYTEEILVETTCEHEILEKLKAISANELFKEGEFSAKQKMRKEENKTR